MKIIIPILVLGLISCSQSNVKTEPVSKNTSEFSPPTAPKYVPEEKPVTTTKSKPILLSEPSKSQTKPQLLAPPVKVKCDIEGPPFRWESGYCLWVSNSKEIHDKGAQKCLNTPRKRVHRLDECKKRVYFKQKMCRHAIKLGYIKMGYSMCMNNKEFDRTWPKKQ